MGIMDSVVAWAGEHETFVFILFMLPFAVGLAYLLGDGDAHGY